MRTGCAPLGDWARRWATGCGVTYGFAGLVSDRIQDPAEVLLDRFREHFADFDGLVPTYLATKPRRGPSVGASFRRT